MSKYWITSEEGEIIRSFRGDCAASALFSFFKEWNISREMFNYSVLYGDKVLAKPKNGIGKSFYSIEQQ